MKLIEYIRSKYTFTGMAVLAAAAVLFLFSLIFFLVRPVGMRLYLFKSSDAKGLFVEKRFLSKDSGRGAVAQYVDDLLLGPATPRLERLFPAGTAVSSCFVRRGTLYLDLTRQALAYPDGKAVTQDSIEIFKKNIFTNFNSINKINIYIMGREVSGV